MNLRFRSGGVTVTLGEEITRTTERALRACYGAIIDGIQMEVEAIHANAVAMAPVKSGRFRAGLSQGMVVNLDEGLIQGTVSSGVEYTRWIRWSKSRRGGRFQRRTSVWQELVAAPLREARVRLVRDLQADLVRAVREVTGG